LQSPNFKKNIDRKFISKVSQIKTLCLLPNVCRKIYNATTKPCLTLFLLRRP